MAGKKPTAKHVAAPHREREVPPGHDAGAFLDLPAAASSYEAASVVVLPLPMEETVSYGGGAAGGPDAIIAASRQVELYDPRLDREPAMIYGVHTLATPGFFKARGAAGKAPAVIDGIADIARRHLAAGKFLVGLGGEHTASLGIARGVAAAGDFTLVHVDAHADLRDSYEDNPLSHACVVRRIAELPECEAVLQLGIRSTTREQMDFIRDHSRRRDGRPLAKCWFAWDMHAGDVWEREFQNAVKGRRVFFTFDVDGLDPSVIPATGTPEPDGLTWRQLRRIVRITARRAASVAAMDCVELAPAPGLHYADFAAARAVYEMMTAFVLR